MKNKKISSTFVEQQINRDVDEEEEKEDEKIYTPGIRILNNGAVENLLSDTGADRIERVKRKVEHICYCCRADVVLTFILLIGMTAVFLTVGIAFANFVASMNPVPSNSTSNHTNN